MFSDADGAVSSVNERERRFPSNSFVVSLFIPGVSVLSSFLEAVILSRREERRKDRKGKGERGSKERRGREERGVERRGEERKGGTINVRIRSDLKNPLS